MIEAKSSKNLNLTKMYITKYKLQIISIIILFRYHTASSNPQAIYFLY